MGSEGHLGTSLEGVQGGHIWVYSGSILRSYLGQSWTLSQKPHHNTEKSLHLAVGRASASKYTKYGVLGGAG